MGQRHLSIGIKQVIRFEWMEKTVNLLLAGLDPKKIREELREYLATKNDPEAKRSSQTQSFVVHNLFKIWVSPDPELIPLRDALLTLLGEQPSLALAAHWAMTSAVYPFWFNVARQTGRLLALQDQVTYHQINHRLKEHYGDRQAVSRCARYVIRSFIAWGVLKDSETKGCYEKTTALRVDPSELVVLMYESALHAIPEGKATLGVLLNHPAFFLFHFPLMRGDTISQQNRRIEVVRYGLDEELLQLR